MPGAVNPSGLIWASRSWTALSGSYDRCFSIRATSRGCPNARTIFGYPHAPRSNQGDTWVTWKQYLNKPLFSPGTIELGDASSRAVQHAKEQLSFNLPKALACTKSPCWTVSSKWLLAVLQGLGQSLTYESRLQPVLQQPWDWTNGICEMLVVIQSLLVHFHDCQKVSHKQTHRHINQTQDQEVRTLNDSKADSNRSLRFRKPGPGRDDLLCLRP